MLMIEDLNAYYGHIRALKNFSLRVEEGEIISIVGPNGAGKTTLLRAIAGFSPPQFSGKVIFKNKDVTKKKPFEKLRLGMAFVHEGKRVFPSLSVKDNLFLGGYLIRKNKKAFRENLDFVLNLFPVLKEMLDKRAGFLSGGEQQMLAVGRALMSSPELICLDEPSFGLAPKVVEAIFKTLSYLRKEKGMSILLVEQDVALALNFSDRSIVIVSGEKQIEDDSKKLLKDKQILELYLGG